VVAPVQRPVTAFDHRDMGVGQARQPGQLDLGKPTTAA